MRIQGVLAGVMLGGLVVSSSAWAVNITISEPHRDKTFPGNIKENPFGPEDNSVEYNAVANQSWDLESFDVVGNQLSLTAGFNFLTGNANYPSFQQGDIFVYLNKTPYSAPSVDDKDGPWAGRDNWDFAITFARDGDGSIAESAGSVGYSVVTSGVASYTGGSSSLITGLPYMAPGPERPGNTATYSATGSGDSFHNTISGIDLSLLTGVTAADDVYFHTALGCGNDVMWGLRPGTSVPDGGLTIAMLGLGLIGLGVMRRKV